MEYTSKDTIDELKRNVLKVIFDYKESGKINEALALELGKHISRTFKYHIEEYKINYENL